MFAANVREESLTLCVQEDIEHTEVHINTGRESLKMKNGLLPIHVFMID